MNDIQTLSGLLDSLIKLKEANIFRTPSLIADLDQQIIDTFKKLKALNS